MYKDTIFSKLDYTLVFTVFLLFCTSLIAIHQAPLDFNLRHINFVNKQIQWYVISGIMAVLIILFDYERLRQIHWFFYGFGIFLLLGISMAQFLHVPVPFVHPIKGAWSWYQLPGIGQIQPSEFMKLFLIISMSAVIFNHNETYAVRTVREDFLLLGKIALVAGLPFLLVLAQPDLGTALVMFAIIFSIVIISGIRWQLILTMVLSLIVGVIAFFIAWFQFPSLIGLILKQHQSARFYGWLDPYKYTNDQGYQLITSLNAVGTGQLFNKGLDPAVFFPEAHTDFIFSVIAGSFGFIGASIVIALYFILIYRMVRAASLSHDPFGSYMITGFIGMFTFQIFENIGMTIQVMPITGITLPFLSYGGSSLLTSLMSIGLILSIQARKRTYMFS
ncbi:rod shape-determining protein RodA [Terrilactibacillus sp. BCM23-1]|uniref:Rod shape-determining protein RodA n=1 Tax=Terrilactibacillus tamarindi TaxID=2599694 RepID=A0A6N8CRJ2_9BACI|nr:FtsW/RodA/SpoVE family cell cycle protein [Terrilactibacillus tamarindi]MTT30586.1 rod shape-determining protein RodA [Terrilactibacillus tamarindi]